MRPRGLWLVVPRAALAWRVPAPVAVRGLVPVARAHRRAHRAHRRGGLCGVRPARGEGSAQMSSEVLARLRALLRAEGGLIATLLDGSGAPHACGQARSPAAVAAAGPRAAGLRREYELLVEAIYEGYLLHYGSPPVVRAEEADLRLLAGDRLYAIGLARLVALGDTRAVAELADTIRLS